MNRTHVVVLAQARVYVAALASTSPSADAALEYESALIELDAMHEGDTPPITDVTVVALPVGETYDAACATVEELRTYGIDRLSVELVLATLADAHGLEQPQPS